MFDKITTYGNSSIQHGHHNERIYLMHLAQEDMPEILDNLDTLAKSHSYAKIFAKVPKKFQDLFASNHYISEGMIPKFFENETDCVFMAKFFNSIRSLPLNQDQNETIIKLALSKKTAALSQIPPLPNGYTLRVATPADCKNMSNLYATVFESYPVPVFDACYIKKTMEENMVYFGIWKEEELVALSSCEICVEDKNVEMTDFAILPNNRDLKLSHILLDYMEAEMIKRGIKTAYTIARAESTAMNCTFGKNNYTYAGTLVQNTQIAGKLEDMNLWFKSL